MRRSRNNAFNSRKLQRTFATTSSEKEIEKGCGALAGLLVLTNGTPRLAGELIATARALKAFFAFNPCVQIGNRDCQKEEAI